MKLFTNINNWINHRSFIGDNENIGFIPTMGALHKGHISLIEKSIADNHRTIVSIFVNPTQFNNTQDLKNYPSTLDIDINLLKKLGVHYVLLPTQNDIYKDKFNYKISEHDLSLIMEGKERPGHFDGVLTIVMKLLNIVNPKKAYFGEKDYQQFKLIEHMVDSFFMNIEIISCPTIREKDGLAFSSRNVLLTKKQRMIAPQFPKELRSKKKIKDIKIELLKSGFEVDYIEKYDKRIFGAVQLGKVRLIDNEKE